MSDFDYERLRADCYTVFHAGKRVGALHQKYDTRRWRFWPAHGAPGPSCNTLAAAKATIPEVLEDAKPTEPLTRKVKP